MPYIYFHVLAKRVANLVRFSDVNIDKSIARSVEICFEGEKSFLVADELWDVKVEGESVEGEILRRELTSQSASKLSTSFVIGRGPEILPPSS